jgi:hypothetical protein
MKQVDPYKEAMRYIENAEEDLTQLAVYLS